MELQMKKTYEEVNQWLEDNKAMLHENYGDQILDHSMEECIAVTDKILKPFGWTALELHAETENRKTPLDRAIDNLIEEAMKRDISEAELLEILKALVVLQ
jgi:hypothetical protein